MLIPKDQNGTFLKAKEKIKSTIKKMEEYKPSFSLSLKTIKIILMVVNLATSIIGALIFAAGIALSIYDEINGPSFALMSIGGMLFFFSFLGTYGTFKENYPLVLTYAVVMSYFVIVEIFAGVIIFYYYSDILLQISSQFKSFMDQYKDNHLAAKTVDLIQTEMGCCGMDGPTDWNYILSTPYNSVDKNKNLLLLNLPKSCCQLANISDKDYSCITYYSHGCKDIYESYLIRNTCLFTLIALFVLSFQFVLGISAYKLGKSIKQQKIKREKRMNTEVENIVPQPNWLQNFETFTDAELKQFDSLRTSSIPA